MSKLSITMNDLLHLNLVDGGTTSLTHVERAAIVERVNSILEQRKNKLSTVYCSQPVAGLKSGWYRTCSEAMTHKALLLDIEEID